MFKKKYVIKGYFDCDGVIKQKFYSKDLENWVEQLYGMTVSSATKFVVFPAKSIEVAKTRVNMPGLLADLKCKHPVLAKLEVLTMEIGRNHVKVLQRDTVYERGVNESTILVELDESDLRKIRKICERAVSDAELFDDAWDTNQVTQKWLKGSVDLNGRVKIGRKDMLVHNCVFDSLVHRVTNFAWSELKDRVPEDSDKESVGSAVAIILMDSMSEDELRKCFARKPEDYVGDGVLEKALKKEEEDAAEFQDWKLAHRGRPIGRAKPAKKAVAPPKRNDWLDGEEL